MPVDYSEYLAVILAGYTPDDDGYLNPQAQILTHHNSIGDD